MKLLKIFLSVILFMCVGNSTFAQVEPLIQNQWTVYSWPYNAYYPESESGVNGHVGNACGYTAVARILHYWGFPVNGTGIINTTDYSGNVWYCDLSDLNLNYTAMPSELDIDASEDEYYQTALLFFAAAVVGEKVGIGYSSGQSNLVGAMQEYFNFKSTAQVVNRWDYSKDEWIEIFKEELDNGRPMLIVGRTTDSPAPWESGSFSGHWWVCDGYNSNDEFYVDYSFADIKGYYDIDNLGGIYTAYNSVIIGLEPDLDGKEITINSPLSEKEYNNSEELQITWTSNNISHVNIDYSIDKGYTWNAIVENVSVTNGSYSWIPQNLISDKCLIKVTDADNVNVYKNSSLFSLSNNATGINDESDVPTEFVLHQNYPNPFNPTTNISYSLSEKSFVQLKVYDILGKEVATLSSETKSAGNYDVEFDGSGYNSGVYFCVMNADRFVSTIKLVLIK